MPQAPLHAVPYDGAADLLGHDEPRPGRRGLFREGMNHEARPAGARTMTDRGPDVVRSVQPVGRRQHRALVQADRTARPLRRRSARMARPARVRIRVRKPWVRLRRRLLGWKVRLVTAYSRSEKLVPRSLGKRRHMGLFADVQRPTYDTRAAHLWANGAPKQTLPVMFVQSTRRSDCRRHSLACASRGWAIRFGRAVDAGVDHPDALMVSHSQPVDQAVDTRAGGVGDDVRTDLGRQVQEGQTSCRTRPTPGLTGPPSPPTAFRLTWSGVG